MTLMTVHLDDKYNLERTRFFITGTQALIRLCLMRAHLDRKAGLNTAGYVTGYRGSPLGGLDAQFPRARKFLDKANIVYEPALNEDLAATALWGAQQAEMRGEGAYDGVFGMWYGKGPGVDRSGDVFRHANLAGTSRHGGVLVLMGDDHTCESSTTCHQSEYALFDAMMPILNPSNVQEILQFGLHGWEMSRFAGLWVGLKCVKDNVESTASIQAETDDFRPILPQINLPADGLNIRPGDTPQAQEVRLHRYKVDAARAYARANGLDRVILDGGAQPRLGIVATGKSYADVLSALDILGIDAARARTLGLSLYKVGMPWPLEPEGLSAFARGLDRLMFVEEKRGLIEEQARGLLYGQSGAPRLILGKRDEAGATLFQAELALNPMQIAAAIGMRLDDDALRARATEVATALDRQSEPLGMARGMYFCAGCPHNSSTVIPEGARGYAGIGCSWMSQKMGRNVDGYTHMGAEGANWIGESRFSTRKHVFQTLGDGTYNHSGLLAIRAAVAAGTNITYKILFNDTVAMTGGQDHEGDLNPFRIAAEVKAAGVARLAFVTDRPDLYDRAQFPPGTTISHRDQLITIQKELGAVEGCTVLLYEQTCAAEKRRRRKRKLMEDPPQRLFINPLVCEGCGDCGAKSNCVAVAPLETEFGRKRQIDQSACNKDFSCAKGFCPSFVSVKGGALRKPKAAAGALPALREPAAKAPLERPYGIVLSGVGGTGVVTIGAILGMAAHLEGRGCGIIDMLGMAQKGGAVTSHIMLAPKPADIAAVRIAPGAGDLVIGCDIVSAAADPIMQLVTADRTRLVINTHEMMTGDFTRNPDFRLPMRRMQDRLTRAVEPGQAHFVNATRLAGALMGDTIAGNAFMLGVAYQHGLVPLSAEAIRKAFELNGIEVAFNLQAFDWGRLWVQDAALVEDRAAPGMVHVSPPFRTIDDSIALRVDELQRYQNARYAERYRALMTRVSAADPAPDKTFTEAVMRNAFKLMAYKDEYEVARLYTDGRFKAALETQFEGDYRLELHLAPPLLARRDKETGHPRKIILGPWMLRAMRLLAPLRRLRGTPFDPFGKTSERRQERALIADYLDMLEMLLPRLGQADYALAVALARLPEQIRGFGHVKEASIAAAALERDRLLARLDGQPASTGLAAE